MISLHEIYSFNRERAKFSENRVLMKILLQKCFVMKKKDVLISMKRKRERVNRAGVGVVILVIFLIVSIYITPDPTQPSLVLTKDIPLNQSNATWLHVSLPREAPDNSSPKTKLPLIVYYHGSGFIVGSSRLTNHPHLL